MGIKRRLPYISSTTLPSLSSHLPDLPLHLNFSPDPSQNHQNPTTEMDEASGKQLTPLKRKICEIVDDDDDKFQPRQQTDKKSREFIAFKFDKDVIKDDGKVKIVTKTISPTTGIHSLHWAQAIERQENRLLRLPYELRLKIYGFAIVEKDYYMRPILVNSHFTTYNNPSSEQAIKTYNALGLASRQMYVDIIGSALLYKTYTFDFDRSASMINFVTSINPAHRDSIRSLKVSCNINLSAPRLPHKVMVAIASLRGLHTLKIRIMIDHRLWRGIPLNRAGHSQFTPSRELLLRIRDSPLWNGINGISYFCIQFQPRHVRWSDALDARNLPVSDQQFEVLLALQQQVVERITAKIKTRTTE